MCQLLASQFAEAIAAFESASQLTDRDARDLASLACANAAAGPRDEAKVILAELMQRRERESVPAEAFVKTYAALGELDHAFEWLERSADDRSVSYCIFDLRLDPLYHQLRADDRLAALFKGLGLDLSTGGD